MDALFHFANPDTRPYKKKNLSLVPSAFHSKNPLNYDKNDEEEELNSPIIYKKKSHFSRNAEKNFSFVLNNCQNDEVEGFVDVEDLPISPLS
jgi:hypothetical protein